MPTFSYEIINENKDLQKGQIESESKSIAYSQLKNQGYIVVELERIKRNQDDFFKFTIKSEKIKPKTLALFCRQNAALLRAGIPITQALTTLAKQSNHDHFKKILLEITSQIEQGISIGNAFQEYNNVFSEIFISMIRTAEITGNLAETFESLSMHYQREKELKDSILTATVYPTIIAIVAFLVLHGMLLFIVPKFIEMTQNSSLELNKLSEIVFSISTFLVNNTSAYFASLVGIAMLIYLYSKSNSGKKLWDRSRYKLPIVGRLIREYVLARFCRVFATMLSGGIPILQSLEFSGPVTGSYIVNLAVLKASDRIEMGESIYQPFSESEIFDEMVVQMIKVGEETGQLPELLMQMAEFYESEVQAQSKTVLSVIEPIMIVIIAIFVMLILLALYLPIMQISAGAAM